MEDALVISVRRAYRRVDGIPPISDIIFDVLVRCI